MVPEYKEARRILLAYSPGKISVLTTPNPRSSSRKKKCFPASRVCLSISGDCRRLLNRREIVEYFLNYRPLGGLLGMFLFTTLMWLIILMVSFEFSRIFRAYDLGHHFEGKAGKLFNWPAFGLLDFHHRRKMLTENKISKKM